MTEPRLHHLLSIEDLSAETIKAVLQKSQEFIDSKHYINGAEKVLSGKTLINLFFENSTRTRVSFELAAKRLGADVVNVDIATSAVSKGESLLDTVYTLQAMHSDFLVIRHKKDHTANFIAEHTEPNLRIINAGDGTRAHPSQALIDMLTIQQHKTDFANLTVAIVGDINHSRVARSDISALQKLQIGELRLVGPERFLPQDLPGAHFNDMEQGLEGADVIMLLRLQRERMLEAEIPDLMSYFQNYGLTEERLKLARPDAIVMHPGPINRGVGLSNEVADCKQSLILDQVRNGIAVRMAILSS